MDLILHFGAHRCATSSFQEYMSINSVALKRQGIGYWGPERTRENGLNSLRNLTTEVCNRIFHDLDVFERNGISQLVISEENFVGTMSTNFRFKALYPNAKERAQFLADAFNGRVTKIALNIRALDTYWSSAEAYRHKRGHARVSPAGWTQIVQNRRRWQDVIIDITSAFPDALMLVLPFEDFAGNPDDQLHQITGCTAPRDHSDKWRNAVRGNRKHSFTTTHSIKLWSDYADDLDWLVSGADGLARLLHQPNTNLGGALPAEIRMDERNSK